MSVAPLLARRGSAPWGAALIAATTIWMALATVRPGMFLWSDLVTGMSSASTYTGSVAAGIAAFEGGRWATAHRDKLRFSGRSSIQATSLHAVSVLVPLVSGLGVSLVVVAIIAIIAGAYGEPHGWWLVALSSALMLTGAFGYALGTLTGNRWYVAPMAAVGFFAMFIVIRGACVACASATLILICGPWGYALNPQNGYLVAAAGQVPILSAIAIQASLASVLGRQEAYVARSMPSLRLLHIGLNTVVAAALLTLAAATLVTPEHVLVNGFSELGAVAIVRNLLALTGAALIGAAVVGPAFAWSLPLAWATIPFMLGARPASDPSRVSTLLMQPDAEPLSFAFAFACWLIGTGLAATGWRARTLNRPAGAAD